MTTRPHLKDALLMSLAGFAVTALLLSVDILAGGTPFA